MPSGVLGPFFNDESVGEFLQVLLEAVLIVLALSFLALGLQSKPLRIDMRPGLVLALLRRGWRRSSLRRTWDCCC